MRRKKSKSIRKKSKAATRKLTKAERRKKVGVLARYRDFGIAGLEVMTTMKNSFMLKVLRIGEPQRPMRIDAPEFAMRYWKAVIKRQPWFDGSKEHMVALLLDTKYHIQGYSLVSIGTLNEALAHPREIFRAAVAGGAYAIITLHNHPSGDVGPSDADRQLFKRLNDAGALLQIRVLDHLIAGRHAKYYALSEEEAAIADAKKKRRRKLRAARRRAAR